MMRRAGERGSETSFLLRASALLRPAFEETQLLRAALLGGDETRRAWQAFERGSSDFVGLIRERRREIRRLAPLLSESLDAAGVSLSSEVRTVLRTAHVHEELRSQEFRHLCGGFFRALTAREVPFCVLKGTALGETVYESPVHRHSHDVEILVSPEAFGAAQDVLRARGLHFYRDSAASGKATLLHPSGLPVVVRSSLRGCPQLVLPAASIMNRSRVAEIASVPCLVPAPEDSLLIACGAAVFAASRLSRVWACDAWLLLHRGRMDWAYISSVASAGGLAIALNMVVSYLESEFGSVVSEEAAAACREAARKMSEIERDAVLYAARAAPEGGIKGLLDSSASRHERLRLLRWIVAPSTGYLREAYSLRQRPWLLPLVYPYRVASRAGRLIRALVPRGAGPKNRRSSAQGD